MNKYLKTIFLHLDGIALSPIYEILTSYSIDQYLLSSSKFKMTNIIDKYKANPGYFNILLKILEAQGVLNKNISTQTLHVTDFGEKILSNCHLFNGFGKYYKESVALIKNRNYDEKKFEQTFNQICNAYQEAKKNNITLISTYIEGALIAPIIIFESFTTKRDGSKPIDYPKCVLDFLKDFNYLNNQADLTKKGQYLLSKAHAYGVPSSYMRTFSHLDDLLFGNYESIWKKDSFNNEYHVNRPLNVWGSGKSHKNYFKDLDAFIEKIFNNPLEKQPLGISDMGCGDGSFLLHLYKLIKEKTLRGQNLQKNPIYLVGADYNQAALDATIETFKNVEIGPITILADIANPDDFNESLKNEHNIDLSDLLSVRSFLDHNRTYDLNAARIGCKYHKISDYSYCWKGKMVTALEAQDDLVLHLKKWKKHTNKHGLVLIELHNTSMDSVRNNLGVIPMISYMATHGFSDQFIIEHDVYKECINKSGFSTLENFQVTYPNKDLKMVSIHMLV